VTIIAAFLEGFGITMLLPVLEFIEMDSDISSLEKAGGMWTKIINFLNYFGLELNLQILLVAVFMVMLMRTAVVYARQAYNAWLVNEVMHTVRMKMYESYMGMNYGAYSHLSSGRIINLLTTEVQRAASSFGSLLSLISSLMVLIAFTIAMLWLSAMLTIFSFVCLLFCVSIVTFYVRHTHIYSYKSTEANETYVHKINERLGAFRLIKLTATEKREQKNVDKASRNLRNLQYWLAKILLRVDLIMEPLILLTGCGILYISFKIFGMSISEVGIFGLILIRSLPIAKEVMKSRQGFYSCLGSINAVLSGYDKAITVKEREGGKILFKELKSGIRLDQVTFSYEETSRAALSDINLVIQAGKTTAVAGPSGAGKTTFADIVSSIRFPQEGRIFFDDLESTKYDLASLRRSIAFVSQDSTILNDTVIENVRFAKYDSSDEEILESLKQAKALEFVESLPNGISTILGERGIKLSGGQKQRISLARSLLQESSILVLDEPTSALDSETERDIKQVIDELRISREITILIIAHRLSTIYDADKIIVLEGGQVSEHGTHKELVESGKWYTRISDMQSIAV